MERKRRTVLRASALGLVGSVVGFAGATEPDHQQTTQETTETARQPEETIVLGGQTEFWYGLAPSAMQGTQNPTLEMQPGIVYEVVWVNLDGVGHKLRLFDANDDEVASTGTASSVGETQSVVVKATESLARYDCEFHPQTMRGDVASDVLPTAEETTATAEETTTTQTTTTEGGGGGGIGYDR